MFNPNAQSKSNSGLFGLPYSEAEAEIIVYPVPWDVTSSNNNGSAKCAKHVLAASKEIDLFHSDLPSFWKVKTALQEVQMDWYDLNKHYRKKAIQAMELMADGQTPDQNKLLASLILEVNEQSYELANWVENQCLGLLNKHVVVGILGGDHSCSLGLIKALSKTKPSFGILQIDAHADLRPAYQNFEFSHASIFYNILKNSAVSKLVQVGVRDYCSQEMEVITSSNGRVKTYFDQYLKASIFRGNTWDKLCDEIIANLPENVYISFDIDGLQPHLCPNTGTPVPGGLEFEQASFLLKKIVDSGRKIIGFDLCEVVSRPGSLDANIAARMLFQLCVQTARTNNLR